MAALEAAGIGSRADVYWILHAVFVNRHEHTILFEQAFDAFWRPRPREGVSLSDLVSPVPAGETPPEPPPPGAARLAEAMASRPPPPPERRSVMAAQLAGSAEEALRAKDFAQMSADEIAQAKRLVAQLALPHEARRTRRFVSATRGAVDARRSFRRSLRAGGAAIDLAFRRPETRPPPLVALVDISGSMQDYSRLFLHFLHALGESGRRVQTFVFATRLTNITRDLRQRDPDEALARAARRVQDWEGGTRIAGCLRGFNRLWSRRVLGQGATLMLITDGLEREVGADLAFEMDRLKRSARRLIWLNPLLRYDGFEPRAAGIRAMLPHVHEFRPIHNLGSMAELVAALGAPAAASNPAAAWLRAAG